MARKKRTRGQLRQLPSGRWQAAVAGPDGRRHKAPRTFASEDDAVGWMNIQHRAIDLGTWGAAERSDGVTLRAYAERWIEQRQLRPRTRDLYRGLLDRVILPALGDMKLVALTPAKVRAWHADLGTAHRTRNAHAYSLLSAICNTAVQDEILDASPCRIRGAMTTRREREIELLSQTELDKLASLMPPELRASVHLAAWCGLRWGETSELRRKDVLDDGAVLHVRRAVTYRGGNFVVGQPKTKAGIRTVSVPPHVRPILLAHLKAHVGKSPEALLLHRNGEHLRDDQYRVHWVKARKAIGKPNLRVHDLRHVGAVLTARAGATTAELMRRLGHTTPAMALRYQHAVDERDAELAERMTAMRNEELSRLAEDSDVARGGGV
ncbi:MAG: site-specific integrase [Leucobacter sp.]